MHSTEHSCREQMDVNVPEPAPHQPSCLQERKHLGMGRRLAHGKGAEQIEHDFTLVNGPACQLANDERMRCHLPRFEEGGEPRVVSSKVLNPNRGIDQDHDAPL